MKDGYLEHQKVYLEVGERVAFYRKRRKLTQERLAEQAGISKTYLSKIESPNCSKGVSLVILSILAEVLDIPLACLFSPVDERL